MAHTILGLDIGGANLKAATPDKRAASVPFALWKQPDRLPAALAELVAKFPDAEELAVTMTGELCDCFETKREGVTAIIKAVRFASAARPIHVWSTDGTFLNSEEAKQNHMKVAAANWHALATFAGRFAPRDGAILIDMGSTTTDIVPLSGGEPCNYCATDRDRLLIGELVYVGVRRTPICAIRPNYVCAELFATTQDVYVALGELPENPVNRDTADGRPLTVTHSLARLARMLGADCETVPRDELLRFAEEIHSRIVDSLAVECRNACIRLEDTAPVRAVITSGAGEFVIEEVVPRLRANWEIGSVVSLNDELGPDVSSCAPAYAVAVLAAERRP